LRFFRILLSDRKIQTVIGHISRFSTGGCDEIDNATAPRETFPPHTKGAKKKRKTP
jgi:hypothetical protein